MSFGGAEDVARRGNVERRRMDDRALPCRDETESERGREEDPRNERTTFDHALDTRAVPGTWQRVCGH